MAACLQEFPFTPHTRQRLPKAIATADCVSRGGFRCAVRLFGAAGKDAFPDPREIRVPFQRPPDRWDASFYLPRGSRGNASQLRVARGFTTLSDNLPKGECRHAVWFNQQHTHLESTDMSTRHCNTMTILVAQAALCLAAFAGQAAGSGFSLDGAADFGILAQTGVNKVSITNDTINGNIGIAGTNGQFSSSGPATINGNLLFAGAVNDSISNTTFNGTITGNDSDVTAAMTAMNNLSTLLASESGAGLSINLNSGQSLTVSASDGIPDGNGDSVFNVSQFNLGSGGSGGLVLSGGPNDYMVFNINSDVSLNGAISLTGGLTSDHVLFNVTGTHQLQSSGNAAQNVDYGVFLDPEGKIQMNEITVEGRVFGGDSQEMQLVSGFNLDAPPPAFGAPEPATLALLAAAATACLAARAWRRRG
jgi:hypothetical protein